MDKPFYVSKEGLEKLEKELNHLQTTRRIEVANRIEKAKDMGDLSENAEYADAKDEKAFLEGKILELRDKVKRAEIIAHKKTGIIDVGSKVVLICNGEERKYHIVGPNDAEPAEGKISNETPLAEGLLGRKVDDEVEINIPAGKLKCVVKKVE
ncbi:MAG: transcription elongation factor GreA [Patescibacteria group bacterium]|nr:transcription elongation factor GreA [Patescibacteria group bacterium]